MKTKQITLNQLLSDMREANECFSFIYPIEINGKHMLLIKRESNFKAERRN